MRALAIKTRSGQQGAALLMALMFLVILTMIGFSSITSTTLEERMARNSRESNIAFQAAETALRDGETDLAGTGTSARVPAITVGDFTPVAAGDCTGDGLCKPATADPQVWDGTSSMLEDTGKSVRYGTYSDATPFPKSPQNTETGYTASQIPSGGVAKQPRYVIEYLGVSGAQDVFRITGIGYGSMPTTKVILQEEVLR